VPINTAIPTLMPCKEIANCVQSVLKLFLTLKMVAIYLGTLFIHAYNYESVKESRCY